MNYGYTAIANYESGRNQPNIGDLTKLANTLNVSIDYLVTGESQNATIAETLQFSLTEANLADMFRTLNKHDQENAFDFITMLYEKTTEAKKSIYATYNMQIT